MLGFGMTTAVEFLFICQLKSGLHTCNVNVNIYAKDLWTSGTCDGAQVQFSPSPNPLGAQAF